MTQIQIKQRPYLTRPEDFQGVPAFIAQILARRGVQSEQELEFKLKHLLAPNLKGLSHKPLHCWITPLISRKK